MSKATGFVLGSQVGKTREPLMTSFNLDRYSSLMSVHNVYNGGGVGSFIFKSTAYAASLAHSAAFSWRVLFEMGPFLSFSIGISTPN